MEKNQIMQHNENIIQIFIRPFENLNSELSLIIILRTELILHVLYIVHAHVAN